MDETRSRIMRSVRRELTGPEQTLASALADAGLEFERNAKDLPGSPDLVFRDQRLAIFVHGCFWHRHPGCRYATTPKTNQAYWSEKFRQNVERDARKVAELTSRGWRVLTVWECELKRDPARVAATVVSSLDPLTRHDGE